MPRKLSQLLAAQRQKAIVERVQAHGGVRVRELVRELGVSDMTIRRDLETLAERGLVTKVHGGAAAARPQATHEPGFEAKSTRQELEKDAIARRAVSFVQPGSAIALSAGTTTWHLAQHLVAIPDLTVVTNSIPVADVFYRRGAALHQTVIVTGGMRTPSDALVGPFAVAAIRSQNIDQLFLGVHGMNVDRGFTTPNFMEAEVDRALVEAARSLIVVADHSKWDMIGLSTIAPLSDADVLITDDGLESGARALIRAEVSELIVVATSVEAGGTSNSSTSGGGEDLNAG
jgi:DeoR/GlpR family transcriptional regulator of sugar metabolism